MRAIDRLLLVAAGALTISSAALGVGAAAVAYAPEPAVLPTPQAECGPGSRPESGLQGRVSPEDHASGRAAAGFQCNLEVVGSYGEPSAEGTFGGYKVERYVDAAGHECAYYDTTLLFPTDAFDASVGVSVLDMSDPTNPVVTATLVTPAMLSPHESLVLNQERGLLVAVFGSPVTNLGIVDVYDVSADCRHPVLRSTSPVGVFGHESGIAPDGLTFYSASPGTQTIVAIDLANPAVPVPLWLGQYPSHGLSVSDDGNRIYVAGLDGLIILDTSEVQARVPLPEVREVARLTWDTMSIPQNAIPVTIDGHPYVIEVDEFGSLSRVGGARIIDIGDETKPAVISNLRLEVHQPEHFAELAGDNNVDNPIQGYAAHYCNVPTRVDPGIVACSMISSGLRVFDITDPHRPREVAYYNAPIRDRTVPEPGSYAMSSPTFVPERHEIWYSDGANGFYALRATNGVFGSAAAPGAPAAPPGPTPEPAVSPSTDGRLPATGWQVPRLFVASALCGAMLFLAVLRRARLR